MKSYEVSIPIFFQPDTDWMCKNDPNVSITTIEKWLHLEFGMLNKNWEWDWRIYSLDLTNLRADTVIFRFDNEEDKVKFILRWL